MAECVLEVYFMPDERNRVQVTMPATVMERLDALCEEMGLKRSAVIALLINEKWKEEHSDK